MKPMRPEKFYSDFVGYGVLFLIYIAIALIAQWTGCLPQNPAPHDGSRPASVQFLR